VIKTFTLVELWLRIMRNQKVTVAVVFVLSTALFSGAILVLPKSYQSIAVFNLYSDYVRMPVAGDYAPDNMDPTDIRSEKDSTIMEAMKDDSLEKIALSSHIPWNGERSVLLQRFREQIVLTSLNRTSYQLMFSGKTPAEARTVNEKLLAEIEQTLKNRRLDRLSDIRLQLQRKRHEIEESLLGGDVALASERSELRELEIARAQERLAVLRKKLTSEHPQIVALEQQILRLQEGKAPRKPEVPTEADKLRVNYRNQSLEANRASLTARIDAIDVTMSLENASTPYFSVIRHPTLPVRHKGPSRIFMLAWAFIGGVVSGVVAGFAMEVRTRKGIANILLEWKQMTQIVQNHTQRDM
jgi:uncharacterized protein involved in exopolysaccharide biosynthesis